jgi:hypothetical protein
MKKLSLVFLVFLPAYFLSAQLIPVKNSFKADLAKVIGDYPNHFKNLLGEVLEENTQSTDYRSQLKIKDAEECTITRYSATGKEIYSWQALMLKTENFEEAVKKFRSLYTSINNLSVQVNGTNIVFKGNFSKPIEEKKFCSIVFEPADKKNGNLKIRVELLLQSGMFDWAISLLVYEKEREDDERGPAIDQ